MSTANMNDPDPTSQAQAALRERANHAAWIVDVARQLLPSILDKISANGLGSLTPQERLFLSNFVPPDDRVPPVS